MIYLISN